MCWDNYPHLYHKYRLRCPKCYSGRAVLRPRRKWRKITAGILKDNTTLPVEIGELIVQFARTSPYVALFLDYNQDNLRVPESVITFDRGLFAEIISCKHNHVVGMKSPKTRIYIYIYNEYIRIYCLECGHPFKIDYDPREIKYRSGSIEFFLNDQLSLELC